MSLDLNKLEKKLDEALSNETTETLNKFLKNKRMKTFNLKEALAGKPVVTRDGLAVTQMTLFETDNIYPLRCVIERCVCEFTTEGLFDIDRLDHKYNLFMATEKKSLWINLYNNEGDLFVTSYKTEVEAKDRGLSTVEFEYIKTIEITNEI